MTDDILERARKLSERLQRRIGHWPDEIDDDFREAVSICTALLAADERARALAEAARDAEREACARVCEVCSDLAHAAIAIRARGQAKRAAPPQADTEALLRELVETYGWITSMDTNSEWEMRFDNALTAARAYLAAKDAPQQMEEPCVIGGAAAATFPDACPHAAPFRYCPVCVVKPCPIGLGDDQAAKDAP